MSGERVKIKSYKDLVVWKKSIRFSIEIYKITTGFPSAEQYGITNQIRRASSSIPANIAEGYGRESTKNYVQFLKIARGSLNETETYLYIAYGLRYISKESLDNLLTKSTELSKMLNSLIRSLTL